MKVYRIGKSQYIKDISGTGAKLYGGRWNRKGLALLYTAEHRSLAALEVLVHLNRNELPDDLKLLSLDIPEESITEISQEEINEIQKNKSLISFKKTGSGWITSQKSLCLKVPSIIIKEEFNILINPNHRLFDEIKIDKIDDFIFDSRLLK